MGDEQGSAHKLGIGAALLAALGGVARFGDDCGRAAVRSGVADDVVRGAKPGVGLADDAARGVKPGAGLLDDVARGPRGARPGLAAAAPAGEGSLLHVADDVAPGAGTSLEESLLEVGVDVAFEVVSIDLPDAGSDGDDAAEPVAAAAAPPRILAAATWPGAKAQFEESKPGDVLGVVVATDPTGAFAFGDERITETELHQRCHAHGVRCVIASCVEGAVEGCVPLAAGIGRKAAAAVPDAGTSMQRSLQLAGDMMRQRDRLRAREITLSRLDTGGESIVRSKLHEGAGKRPPRAE